MAPGGGKRRFRILGKNNKDAGIMSIPPTQGCCGQSHEADWRIFRWEMRDIANRIIDIWYPEDGAPADHKARIDIVASAIDAIKAAQADIWEALDLGQLDAENNREAVRRMVSDFRLTGEVTLSDRGWALVERRVEHVRRNGGEWYRPDTVRLVAEDVRRVEARAAAKAKAAKGGGGFVSKTTRKQVSKATPETTGNRRETGISAQPEVGGNQPPKPSSSGISDEELTRIVRENLRRMGFVFRGAAGKAAKRAGR